MKILLPRPPSELILGQELKLAGRNYISGTFLFNVGSTLTAYLIYSETQTPGIIVWWGLMLGIAAVFSFYFYRQGASFGDNPTPDLIKLICILAPHSLVYTWMIYTYIPTLSYELTMTLSVITVGMAAGSVSLTAPMLPAFYTLSYPSIMTLIVSLYYRPETTFTWLAFGSFGMILGLSWFAIVLANTIRQSVEASFQKEALVKKLRSALVQTDEANRAKSVFLASASHDLRQPLHALGLLTETLGHTKLDKQQADIQEHMLSAVDSTRNMLDSLLNISKLDAGAIMAKPKPFLVQSIFSKLESELAPIADDAAIIYRTRETINAAYSDPQIVELILRNLIANAIRYTDKGGLLVACRNTGEDRLSIEVWDTGVGIPNDKIEDMFREFQQLENPERDATKGFGLGLSIAQGLARTLDSKITVRSVYNQGSVFRFEIPRSSAAVIEDLPRNTNKEDFKGQSIAVIDDDRRVRESMHNLMVSWGCRCISGESAGEILSQADAHDHSFDLLIVDYRLREGVTGKETIHEIRASLKEHVPAIIITGDTDANRIVEAQSSDALLLHKPASTRQLRRMMLNLLNPE